jgi:PAS domain S-box-containing protein
MTVSRRAESEGAEQRELEALYRTSPLGLGLVDGDLRYVRVNQRLAEFAGMSAEDMLGRTTREVVPEIAPKTEPIYRRVLETGQPVLDVEISGPTRAEPGRERRWLASYSPLESEGGRVVGVSVTVRDITENWQERQALEQQLGFQRLLTELSARFAVLRTDDIDEAIEAALARIGTLLDISRIALIVFLEDGTEFEITHGYAQRPEHRPARAVVSDRVPWFTASLREGKTFRICRIDDLPAEAGAEREYMLEQGFKAFLTIPMRVGETIVGAISYSDMRGEREWPDHFIEQLRVISQLFGEALVRKRTGQLLTASQEQFKNFMDNNPAGAYMKDEDLGHVYANRLLLELFGISLDKFLGTTSRDFLGEDIAETVEDADRRVLSGDLDVAEAELCVEIDGETRWFRDTKFALAGPGGEPRVGGIALDITERKRAELDLEQQARFEALLSDISARFVNVPPGQIDAAITDALEQVGDCLELDRCTLGHLTPDGAQVRVTHVWSRDPVDGIVPSYIAADYPWFVSPFLTGEELLWSRNDGLPPGAEADLQVIEALNLQCFAGIPMMIAGKVAGCVGFINCSDSTPWNLKVVQRLHLLARVFGSAIERQRQDLELRHAYSEIQHLKEHLEAENITLKQEVKASYAGDEIVGKSAVLREVLFQVEQVAPTDSTVLLLGETGVGKELVARAIHARSHREDQPLITVNCAALPSSLIESELFGHEKGAFTGAVGRKIGRFEVADGGTILLDEIGDLALELQVKLLRVLQEGRFERLGSAQTRTVDVRVIAATNRDLDAMVARGEFREDLYYRLGVFPIRVPPLRERRADIPLLVWYFVSVLQTRLGRTIKTIPPQTMEALSAYDWPGNVRELQNVMERAMILSRSESLELGTIIPARRARKKATATRAPDHGVRLEDAERAHILAVLESCDWKIGGQNGAAERLGLKRSTLHSRMKKLGIQRPAASRHSHPAPASATSDPMGRSAEKM